MILMVAMKLLTAYHVEQAERVEEASLRVFKLLLLNRLLLLRLPPPHLKIRFEKVFFFFTLLPSSSSSLFHFQCHPPVS